MKITDISWTPAAFIPIEDTLAVFSGMAARILAHHYRDETRRRRRQPGQVLCRRKPPPEQFADLKPLLIGEGTMNLERIRWKLATPSSVKLFGYALGFAGLEFAILDIQGKALNGPYARPARRTDSRRDCVFRLPFLSLSE